VGACTAIATGDLDVDLGADRDRLAADLQRLPGIGPWTAQYVLMRALGDPDVFMPTDLGVRQALERLGADPSPAAAADQAKRFSPWRSYALHHLWHSLADGSASPSAPSTKPEAIPC
jgi:AraC family transcriptional regulator of adaptative response / DNA-3-methyladenine glycosylase II